jgi:hypothetical protein
MSWLMEPDEEWDTPPSDGDRPKSRLRILALVLAGWLVVSALVLIGLLAFGGRHSAQHPIASADQSATTPAAAPTPSSSATPSRPSGWTQRASDDQTNCAAHAYGQVQLFFRRIPCSSVHRELDTTTRSGRTVVIATSMVTFATTADAAAYRALVTTDGTGNVSDLLREGVRYPGGPAKLATAAFDSHQSGTRVLVAEAAYAVGVSNSEDTTLKAMAAQAVTPR